jgi:hypothetical protein
VASYEMTLPHDLQNFLGGSLSGRELAK